MRVFLSHAWIDQSHARIVENPRRGLAQRLRDALRAAGADVYFDDDEIEDLDDIQARIREGLATSTLLVCWYSDAYRERRACHWELLAGITSDPSRVVVVNPEPTLDHVLPTSLRNALMPTAPLEENIAGWQALAERIVRLAQERGGTFGRPPADVTRWYGDPPARFSRFIGRARQLWELDSLLRPPHALSGGTPPPAAVVLHGLGGVGKTAVVLEYAARFAGAYPRGIFWLRATTDEDSADAETQLETRLVSALLLVAAQVEPGSAEVDGGVRQRSAEDTQAIIRRHLIGGKYLWVIDDFPAGLSADALRRWLPPGDKGQVLVTTRGATYRHLPNVSLGVLEPNESIELLEAAGTEVGDRETTEALAKRLGHLPLALEVVGALASVPGTSPADLLAELRDPLGLVEEAAESPFASASATEHPLSVAETFGPSLRRLDNDSLGVLIVASSLNVGPLPTSIIKPVADAVTTVPGGRFARALGMLLSRSLARRLDGETFEVHALVAAATLQWGEVSDAFRHECFDTAADQLVTELGDVEDITTHPVRGRVADFGQALVLSPRQAGGAHELALLRALGRFFHVEARLSEAIALERQAATLAADRFEEDPRSALAAMLNLGLSLHHAGASEADDIVRNALRELEARFGSDDLDVLTAKHNLASFSRGNDREAKALGLQVFEARRRLLGMDHPHTLFSLHTLIAADVLPKPYPDFVAAYEDLIARRSRVLGPDHTTTLTSMSNFVDRLLRLGNPSAAVPLARRVVERRAALYGPDHTRTLSAKGRLLGALTALPEPLLSEVETLAEELESALRSTDSYSVYGQNFNSAVTALSTACVYLQVYGRADLAVRLLSAALPNVVERLGPSARTTLLIEHNLAAAIAKQGDLEPARDRFEGLLERMHQHLGADDRLTLRAQRQQSLIGAGLGRVAQALDEQLRLAQVWEARAGAFSPELAEALGDIADTLDRSGDSARARDYRERQHVIASTVGAGAAHWV